jgi:hypothetical protein
MDTMETWVNGGEIILKKVVRAYSYRPTNKIAIEFKGFLTA